jgi:DNA-directed RNA polymerase subunit RPC12/RpoP
LAQTTSHKIHHISCPGCGGSIHVPEGSRVITCPYCSGSNLLIYEKVTSRYYIEPVVDKATAKRSARKAISAKSVAPALSKRAKLLSAKLVFVPFYETAGKNLGTILGKKEIYEVARDHSAQYEDSRTATYAPRRRVKQTKDDTRVEFRDFYYTGPAVSIRDWNLDKIDLRKFRAGLESSVLMPFDIMKMQQLGTVYNPTIPAETFEKNHSLEPARSSKRIKMFTAEQRTRIIYYPLWVIKYSFSQRLYQIVVDGFRSGVIAGRAPQREDRRIPYMLAICILLALPLGKMFALAPAVFSGSPGESAYYGLTILLIKSPLLLLFVLLGFFLVFFFFLMFAWDEFRYAGEVNFSPEGARITKINRPALTLPEKIFNGPGKVFGTIFKGSNR